MSRRPPPARPPLARSAARAAAIPGLDRAVQIGALVFLRFPTRDDRDEFVALRRRSRAFLEPWEPRPPPGRSAFGPSAFDRFLESSNLPDRQRLLTCRLTDGTLVGTMNLSNIARGVFQNCTIGYWLGQEHTRRGYMTDALHLTLRHAFRTLRLHRVEANIQPRNAASIALVRRCGFRLEGTARSLLQIAGRWEDHQRWAITAEEWRREPEGAGSRPGPEGARRTGPA